MCLLVESADAPTLTPVMLMHVILRVPAQQLNFILQASKTTAPGANNNIFSRQVLHH